MSTTERPNSATRPLKTNNAPNRNVRAPVTPRIAAVNGVARTGPAIASRVVQTPRVKQGETPVNDVTRSGNITPRSAARSSRVDSPNLTPSGSAVVPSTQRPKSVVSAAPSSAGPVNSSNARAGDTARSLSARPQNLALSAEPIGRPALPLVASPGNRPSERTSPMKSNFFHASDAPKQQEPAQKKVDAPKKAAFFHADGRQDTEAPSPVLSAVSDQRSTGPWIRPELISTPSMSPPLLSPNLSSLSSTSPYFSVGAQQNSASRPPSLSNNQNIHLSYRKGVSQIFPNASQLFGARPTPLARSTAGDGELSTVATNGTRRSSESPKVASALKHQKSPSLSSIDSGNTPSARRRSATTIEQDASPSPLMREMKAATLPRVAALQSQSSAFDTSQELSSATLSLNGPLSPTKAVSDFAAEARRERKVLDLEISNSSLLAINSSLEREVRRQKAELKRFRRLSRAGRFSYAPGDRPTRPSDGLSVVGEEDEEQGDSYFGPASGLSGMYDDLSDSDDEDDESLTSSVGPTSPSAQSHRERDRLAKDEKRLKVDLERHRELLVQSQAMNQSIKRCTYATEDMIREGRKALEYHVRVSDVKLGGRVLSSHEDDEDMTQEIEIEDDQHDDDVEQAKGFLDVWAGIGRPSVESSEGGDRDSGIEADRPPPYAFRRMDTTAGAEDHGRPPGGSSTAL